MVYKGRTTPIIFIAYSGVFYWLHTDEIEVGLHVVRLIH